MGIRIPNQAEGHFLTLILAVNYTLRLYKNNAILGLTETQINALTESAFTEATFTGYSAAVLTGGSWTITTGDPSFGVYALQTFMSSANQAAQSIYGYYVTRNSDGKLEWFEHFSGPVIVQFNLDFLEVIPRYTFSDSSDTDHD